jgi:hypothetical protein
MKKEYDFTHAERGKFYKPDVRLNIPVYLDEEALKFVTAIADQKKKEVSAVVNELIKAEKRIARIIQ